jgi:HK97 family phage major capsid protein
MTPKELREKRLKIVTEARKLIDKAGAEKRSMTAEENGQFDSAMTEADVLKAQIDRLEQLEGEERQINASAGRKTDPERPGAGNPGDAEARDQPLKLEFRAQPGSAKRYEEVQIPAGTPAWKRGQPAYRSAYDKWLAHGERQLSADEYRDLQADSDVAGGFLNTPIQMVQMLLKFVDNAVYIRQKASVFQVPTATSLGVPTLDADIDDASWTAELATGGADTGMAFGKRELRPYPLAKRIKISNKLLRTAILGPEAIVRDRLAYKFGIAQEKGFMTGTGAEQPLGLFTASANGITTARDVTCGTTTAITADGLIDTKFSVKAQYQKSGEWVLHRDGLKQTRKLKDGNGQYLWQAGLASGQPDTILDRPYTMSEYAPNTFTTGLYVALFGDLSFYWIADALNMQVQRLAELYAETNQIGFIGRLESDGQPVLAEAFARGKLA